MRTILALCLTILCKQVSAQEKNFTGYYINTTGDSVKGTFPRYNQSNKSPERFVFVPASSSTSIQLTPFNCRKLSIIGYDEYLSYSGNRLINPIDDGVAMDNRGYFSFQDSTRAVSVFLRLVVRTPSCNIYLLNDKERMNFFYELPGEPLQELRYKKYFDENNIHEVTEYRQQLSNSFNEEILKKHLTAKLEQLPYSEDGILQFIEKLFPEKKQNVASATNFLSGWIIGGGASLNSLNVVGDPIITETQLDYPSSLAPYLSLGYLMSLQRNFNRYFFYPQIRFSNYKNSSEKTSGSFNKRITFKSDLIILPQINLGANIINKSVLRCYIYAGAGITTLINNREIVEYFDPIDNTLYNTYERNMAPLAVDLNLSAGIMLKNKFQILVSYNFPTDIDNFVDFTSRQSNIQMGIGYKFAKHKL